MASWSHPSSRSGSWVLNGKHGTFQSAYNTPRTFTHLGLVSLVGPVSTGTAALRSSTAKTSLNTAGERFKDGGGA
jgi:hypothetical protein